MCGIAGIVNVSECELISLDTLTAMLGTIRHRGPDGSGIYREARAGLGNVRLSIIDISGGDQPIGNEDGSLWIVFNGEIFNYIELRPELERLGHQFTTHSDTEVVLHLYEEYGPGCLKYLNGQFAIAIWNEKNQSLFLARDRVGIRPVFYTQTAAGQLIFASEIKAILVHPRVNAEIDPEALRETFTYWSPFSPHTIFKGIYELPPAHYLLVKDGQVTVEPYWSLDFAPEQPIRRTQDYLDEMESLLIDATQIRLRADVPVGAYLSGGLDSSLTTAIIRRYNPNRLDTFSISFSDQAFDESHYQGMMAEHLGTDHHEVFCDYQDIARSFPDVIYHTETPILRTAPVPMFLLSALVREHNFKVVMTGEGADEFLAGYDIFKEMKIRRFWARDPESTIRPRLLSRLYPDINRLGSSGAFLTAFFKRDLTRTDSPFYSHAIRWNNTARTWRFLAGGDSRSVEPEGMSLPSGFWAWPIASAGFVPVLERDDQNRVERVIAYINQHLAEPIDRDVLAANAHLSPSAFSRFFKLRTGKSLPRYLNELRVGRACRLLADEHVKIVDIALQCGFNNLANFNRRFREITGLNPSDYRRRLQESAS